jgi:para-aminobenzoate synthetase
MKTLIIDNYDSFTFNLYQLIAEVNQDPPIVVHNDTAPWDEIRDLAFDNIVISPGPGRPEKAQDFGICRDAILESTVPVLGVCLGHQGLCHLFGGSVDYAETVMHGRASEVRHNGQDVFVNFPSPFQAVRYHSLHVTELPDCLEAIAWTEDDILMGVRHRQRPIWGVQFHPESICTEFGHQLMANFRALTEDHQRRNPLRRRVTDGARPTRPATDYDIVPGACPVPAHETRKRGELHGKPFSLYYRRLPIKLDAEAVFCNLFVQSEPSFWLDSAMVRGFSRFSYMGDACGPHAEYVSYSVPERLVQVTWNGETKEFHQDIFSYLEHSLQERHTSTEGLPFDFNLGYAGYFGYELKGDCGGTIAHRSEVPDASFVFADRLLAFDHEEGVVYLVCLEHDDQRARAEEWMEQTWVRLHNLQSVPSWKSAARAQHIATTFRHPPEQYRELIEACKNEIRHGETYEVCLTNMLSLDVEIDPLNSYRALRSSNPAPYAAFLDFPGVAVLSSSPERFLTVDANQVVEAKPIKGTRRRGASSEEDEFLYQDLRNNEKDRSENLMIVDLLRNDLGKVCEVGSVHVSHIFAVESYATVHQLVSTVRGKLRRGQSALQCVREAFPGGSMTGAPKIRTMEIIDRLEAGPRGIYSGAIGFCGLNGSADLNIVIRSAVVTPSSVTVGVGGAIIDLSDPQEEIEEMLLKSKAVVRALAESAIVGSERKSA